MPVAPQEFRRERLSLFRKSLPLLTALALAWPLGFRPVTVRAADALAEKADKAAEDVEPKEAKPPEDIDLGTDDGVALKATFFPGMKDKESIPVIIMHGLDAANNRKEYTQDGGLAEFLQTELGCAVIVPDLRGHGESIKIDNEKVRAKGKALQEMLRKQHMAMVRQDLRAVKDYLWKKNNEGKLNIDKLVVVGVEGGAALALSYADYDSEGYENGAPKYGPLKLGLFVKAAVLISPQVGKVTFLNAEKTLTNPAISRDLQFLILSGNKSRDFVEATTLYNRLLNARPGVAAAPPKDKSVWFYSTIDTKLQGTKLLGESSLDIPGKIKGFMTARMIKNPDAKEWVWKVRKLPHE